MIGQGAASDDLNAEHPEVVGLNPLEAARLPIGAIDLLAPGNQERHAVVEALEGQRVGAAAPFTPGTAAIRATICRT